MTSDLGTVTVCNKCQVNVAEIFQESGEFCLHCWQKITCPNISMHV
jgi:hypothetical protein